MKYTFPDNYGDECILVPIDKSLIPFISGALQKFFEQYVWETYEDFEQGYNAFAEVLISMGRNNCLQELIDGQNRLYRLLDTALNGTTYTVTPAQQPQPAPAPDPTRPTISPALPVAPPASSPAELPAFALRARLERLINLVDNLSTGQQFPLDPAFLSDSALQNNVGLRETLIEMQGVINAGWFGIGGQRATIADLVTSLRLGSQNDKNQVLTVLDLISGAGSGATIFNTVREFFADSADVGLEGAQIVTSLVAIMAQITSNTLQEQKLDRIIRALDGGALFPPAENLTSLAIETRDLLEP